MIRQWFQSKVTEELYINAQWAVNKNSNLVYDLGSMWTAKTKQSMLAKSGSSMPGAKKGVQTRLFKLLFKVSLKNIDQSKHNLSQDHPLSQMHSLSKYQDFCMKLMYLWKKKHIGCFIPLWSGNIRDKVTPVPSSYPWFSTHMYFGWDWRRLEKRSANHHALVTMPQFSWLLAVILDWDEKNLNK